MDRLQVLEEGDSDNITEAVKLATEAPVNLQDPVQTRWGTVLPAVGLFANQWVVIYFFAITLVASSEKTDSYITTLSCALLSLMNTKKLSKNDGKEMDDAIIETTTVDSIKTALDASEKMLEVDYPTPIFLAELYFLDGFNKYFFQGKCATIDACDYCCMLILHRLVVDCCITPQTCLTS